VPGDEGVEAAERALSLDPDIAEAYCPIVRQLIEQRRYAEAEAQLEKALALDPDSWEVNKEGLRLHIRQRHFREAAEHQEKCVACMETDFYGWWTLMSCRRAIGESEAADRAARAALDQAQAVLSENPNNGAALSVAAHALAHLGDEEGARELIERGLRVDPGNLNMRYNFGSALAVALNQPDEAFTHLEAALAKATGTLIRWVEIDPDVDSLRDDPRFQAMLAEAKARSAPKRGEPANA
jgi:adenylate cyclase